MATTKTQGEWRERCREYDQALARLVMLQAERKFDALNETVLAYEEAGGDLAEAQSHFELYLANERYADWHAKNSCGYDEVINETV